MSHETHIKMLIVVNSHFPDATPFFDNFYKRSLLTLFVYRRDDL